MGLFSSWHRADDFDLTAEDLATCEGYVSAEAFRKLHAAKAAARSDVGGSLYALARLAATRIIDVMTVDREAASGGSAKAVEGASPVTLSVQAGSSTASSPTPTDHRVDKAA